MNCRIYKNEPNSAQRRVLRNEVAKEFDKLLENFNHDVMVQMLYLFHFKYGYGKKRLAQLNKDIAQCLGGLHARYELSEDDTIWLCEKKLAEDGIDINKLLE